MYFNTKKREDLTSGLGVPRNFKIKGVSLKHGLFLDC